MNQQLNSLNLIDPLRIYSFENDHCDVLRKLMNKLKGDKGSELEK